MPTAGTEPVAPPLTVASRVAPRVATSVAIWVLAASVGCQLWFGPLVSSGRFFISGTRGRHLPTTEERTLTPYRDRMVTRVPRRGAVVASFEYLARFTARDSVHSLHHIMSGTYTFSSHPYPPPTGVSALIADLAATNIAGAVDPVSATRLQRLVRDNRLVPVDAAGDLVLFTRDAQRGIDLMSAGACGGDGAAPLVFDRALAFLGGGLADSAAHPGQTVTLQTCWRRVGNVDRFFQTRFDLVDAAGRSAQAHTRDLGYLLWPPHVWVEGTAAWEYFF